MEIVKKVLDKYDGHTVTKITLKNDNGVEISCLTMGALWQEFLVPAGEGKKNLLLSFDNTKEYYSNAQNVCKSIGRVAGRIANAHYQLDGKQFSLPANENGNTLHGGDHGFSSWNWNYSTSQNKNSVSAIFQKNITQEMDGFPGNIIATIIYTLTNNNKVTIAYSALGDNEDSLFNPTMHVYFNPSDHSDLSTLSLKINSEGYLDLDDKNIPTGRVCDVTDTPCDFRDFTNLAKADQANHGFDTAFVVNEPGQGTKPVAILRDEESGREITIDSDRNGLVMYTMPGIDAPIHFTRDHGKEAHPGEGVALEAQMLPDAINQENFGDIVLPKYGKKTYRIQYSYNKIK
ncbi:aldose 1-epimerase [Ligilactobacillus sp. WC1T17]|uniref:Aldose 1-epimerase n=1 Tax=Ligilactobacillus ruminis TaxID=1623 RepID=A0ABY1AB98_9LACO|nr:aldose 1-epimerase [Ligilactobacillus ruminis]